LSLERASLTQLRWIEQISEHLPQFHKKAAEIYLMFRLDQTRAAFACLRPLAECVRLYTLLEPHEDARLRPGTSTRSFKRWHSQYDIVQKTDLSEAEDLIRRAAGHAGAQMPGRRSR